MALSLLVVLTACFKEIDTVPMERSPSITMQNKIYDGITFFKITEEYTEETLFQPLGTWDLAFQSSTVGDIVLVNYTSQASAINTGISDFASVNKGTYNSLFTSDQWRFNDPSFSNVADSSAMFGWESGNVFIVQKPGGSAGNIIYKVQFVSKTTDSYTFKYAQIEETVTREYTISRISEMVNVYFSLANNTDVSYEPVINDWHFYLAPYDSWYETNTPGVFQYYYVTGVMINNEGGVTVAEVNDENIDFDNIDMNFANGLNYSEWKGVIGSRWKLVPNPDNPFYSMDPNRKYIIKLNDGSHFKLRFTDFYNPEINDLEEAKGYISFEIKHIN